MMRLPCPIWDLGSAKGKTVSHPRTGTHHFEKGIGILTDLERCSEKPTGLRDESLR